MLTRAGKALAAYHEATSNASSLLNIVVGSTGRWQFFDTEHSLSGVRKAMKELDECVKRDTFIQSKVLKNGGKAGSVQKKAVEQDPASWERMVKELSAPTRQLAKETAVLVSMKTQRDAELDKV